MNSRIFLNEKVGDFYEGENYDQWHSKLMTALRNYKFKKLDRSGKVAKRTRASNFVASGFSIDKEHKTIDIVIKFANSRIVSIESGHEITGLINKACRNKRWADYCYVCVPRYRTYTNNKTIKACIDIGIGVLFFHKGELIEAVYADRKNRAKDYQGKMINRMMDERLMQE